MKLYLWPSHKTSRNRSKPIKWCAFLFNVKIVYTARWRIFATPDTPCSRENINILCTYRFLIFNQFLVTKAKLYNKCRDGYNTGSGYAGFLHLSELHCVRSVRSRFSRSCKSTRCWIHDQSSKENVSTINVYTEMLNLGGQAPIFGRSVNPVPTGGVQIILTYYYFFTSGITEFTWIPWFHTIT